MKKNFFILVMVVLLFGVVFSGCVSDANSKVGAENQETLKIGVIVYPGFAPFFIADEKNFFEKEGVNAEVVMINDPAQAISVLASNNVQLLFSSADFTPIIVDAGVDVKEIFASDIGYGSDGLLVKDDVNSILDLKGKTVYLAPGMPSNFLFRYLAKEQGLSKDDITIVPMDVDQVGVAFVSGQIDYGMSWEPWLSKASERKDGKLLLSSKDKPGIITDTFVVRSDVLQSRREGVKKVVRAWFDSLDFMKSNSIEANEIMAKNLGLPVEDFAVQLETVKFLDYADNLKKFDKANALNLFELSDKAVEIYREDEVISSNPNPETFVDPSILAELYK
ncbi:MAG: ABC transporter substrate-binding protein [Candidatus Diapherotrites archaeon]|nr:ABC transporter substrate-binding protein [Candidatus Diapherotrites archaeon]